jgi:hypothetical protein
MYDIEEFYALDGLDIKDVLKDCILNYYIQYNNLTDGATNV